MALPSFKNFLKDKTLDNKIKLAAKLIERTQFPIKAYAKWYENTGMYLSQEQFLTEAENWTDYWKELGGEALSGAGAGALGGAAVGGPLGAFAGAGAGGLGRAAWKVGSDIYNWSQSGKPNHFEKQLTTNAEEAEKILNKLKQVSEKLAGWKDYPKAQVATQFAQQVDALIKQLQQLQSIIPNIDVESKFKTKQQPEQPEQKQPTNTEPTVPPEKVQELTVTEEEIQNALNSPSVQEILSKNKLFNDLKAISREFANIAKNPKFELTDEEIVQSLLLYQKFKNIDNFEQVIKDFDTILVNNKDVEAIPDDKKEAIIKIINNYANGNIINDLDDLLNFISYLKISEIRQNGNAANGLATLARFLFHATNDKKQTEELVTTN